MAREPRPEKAGRRNRTTNHLNVSSCPVTRSRRDRRLETGSHRGGYSRTEDPRGVPPSILFLFFFRKSDQSDRVTHPRRSGPETQEPQMTGHCWSFSSLCHALSREILRTINRYLTEAPRCGTMGVCPGRGPGNQNDRAIPPTGARNARSSNVWFGRNRRGRGVL